MKSFPYFALWQGLSFVTLGLLLNGCAPALIPHQTRQAVARGVTFQDVLGNPDNYKGDTVLWGGEVLGLKNAKEGTSIEVLETPLDSQGRPVNLEVSEGRFIVFTPTYLDREVYRHGRFITVLGQVEGHVEKPLGKDEITYTYPLVNVQKIYLWPLRRPPPPVYYLWPGWGWNGYGGPAWNSPLGLGWEFGAY